MANAPVCICAGCRELQRQLKIMDGAMGIAMEMVAAFRPLIPEPETLSPEKREQWQQVVDRIIRAAEYADEHDLTSWGGKISTAN